MSEEQPARAAGRHVLVVEDHPDGRESLRLLLSLLGDRVTVAADGDEGVRLGLRLRPQAAVVDLHLPRLDGYQVARRLRAALGRGVVLIAHTAYGQPEDRERALAAGFDPWLSKPAEPRELVGLLHRGGPA